MSRTIDRLLEHIARSPYLLPQEKLILIARIDPEPSCEEIMQARTVLETVGPPPASGIEPVAIDHWYLERQIRFSEQAFGPGFRRKGVIDHIRKELIEIEDTPENDLSEWIDVIILALDGAWRTGASPADILQAVHDKLKVNEGREWPDWRTASADEAIEHVKDPLDNRNTSYVGFDGARDDHTFTVEVGGQIFTAAQWDAVQTYMKGTSESRL